MSSVDFAEQIAYERINPSGEERADLRMGILASVMANLWSGGKKKWKPSDFMPTYGAARKAKDPRALVQKILRWKQLYNASLKQGGVS